jgi:lambda repressor-like predicted transcriptional regulator
MSATKDREIERVEAELRMRVDLLTESAQQFQANSRRLVNRLKAVCRTMDRIIAIRARVPSGPEKN